MYREELEPDVNTLVVFPPSVLWRPLVTELLITYKKFLTFPVLHNISVAGNSSSIDANKSLHAHAIAVF